MLAWKDRPEEIANLLNPAFCGEILRRAIQSYCKQKQARFPFILLYLVLPVVLTRNIRTCMPQGNERPKMHPWIEKNAQVKIGFASKVDNYCEITNEAVLFLSKHNLIEIDDAGTVNLIRFNQTTLLNTDNIEHPDNIFKAARRTGLWFSEASAVSSIFAMWGITL